MATYGYVRVSTKEQNVDRQVMQMHEVGLDDRHIYIDKVSGRSFNRPKYNLLVGTDTSAPLLREGDVLVFTSLDRMGRNYTEIKQEWLRLTDELKVDIQVLDMPLLDTRDPQNKSLDKRFINSLVLEILSYVAEKEREMIRIRQRDGIEAARAKGKLSGRPRIPYPPNWDDIYNRWQNGEMKTITAVERSGLKAPTFYKMVQRYESEKGIKRKRRNGFIVGE